MVNGKLAKVLPLMRVTKLIKKHNRSRMKFKNYIKLISGGMIGMFNYVGTSLDGLIQEVKSKGKNIINFLQKNFT